MNTKQRLTCAAILAAGALLTGCESMMHYAEYASACHESQGGSRLACDQLARDRAAEAERQGRIQDAEAQERIGAEYVQNKRAAWASEVAAANDEDRALVRATYPGIGSLSGVWCLADGDRYDRLRVEVLSHDEIRRYTHTRLHHSSGFTLTNRETRDRLEATDGTGRAFRITHRYRPQDPQNSEGYVPVQPPYSTIETDGGDRLRMFGAWYGRCQGW